MFGNRPPASPPLALSAKARRTQEAPISALIGAAVANPDLISFAAGLVDPTVLPAEQCLAITQRILADRPRAQTALQYGTTQGLKALRQQVVSHVEQLEGRPASSFSISADDVIVTTGSQQTLYLVADSLVDPGDIVIAGNPSYFVFTGTLQSLGAQVLTVPMDGDGMDVDAVERLLERLEARGSLPRVKFIYCTSYFDNPTGLTLSLGRRQRLVEIVKRFSRAHRILVLEDAAYRELRYDSHDLASIKSFDATNQYTILTQTFSKPFAPGLKLGYTLMPPDLMHCVLHQKGNHDFGTSNLCQEIALETMRDGSYCKHVEVLRVRYRSKRDALLAALRRHMPPSPQVRWTEPRGGLYVWLTLPPSIDTSRQGPLFKQCLDRGVLYVPGEYCFQPDGSGHIPRNCLRLCFGQVTLEQIQPGIQRLAETVKQQMDTTASPASPGCRAQRESGAVA